MWFKKKKNIIVWYVNVDHLESSKVPMFMENLKTDLSPTPDGCYVYYIPVRGQGTHMEAYCLS